MVHNIEKLAKTTLGQRAGRQSGAEALKRARDEKKAAKLRHTVGMNIQFPALVSRSTQCRNAARGERVYLQPR